MKRIVLVAGELSSDTLGADLIPQLKLRFPEAEFVGIGGPKMQAAGLQSLAPMEPLSVMGLGAVLRNLRQILKLRRRLLQYCLGQAVDLYIGIDAPDFNLGVEEKLKKAGIKTVHYVSPSIWAWKAWRIHQIKRATDLVLCLLPFEVELYQAHQHPAVFVGHPLADQIPLKTDMKAARETLGLRLDQPCLTILPGSRSSELQHLLKPFMEALRLVQASLPTLQVILPLAKPELKPFLAPYSAEFEKRGVTVLAGQSQLAMQAADVVLMACGTAALEAMLFKKPMVVGYRVGFGTFWLAKSLLKIRQFALPNIIAGKVLVPEFIQEACEGKTLAQQVLNYLAQPPLDVVSEFDALHVKLRCHASERAAVAIANLISGGVS